MLVAVNAPTAIAKHAGIEQVEAALLNTPQIDCPVAHHFGPGIYIREVTLPAGTLAIGHKQKHEHLNIMLTGKVAMVDDDSVRVLEAPLIFTGKPGRKIGYVIERCVWQNVYATHVTDIDALESHYLDKSDTWAAHESEMVSFRYKLRQPDRDDFALALGEIGIDEATVRKQSENVDDFREMGCPWNVSISVRDSDIEGKGLFLTWPVTRHSVIAPARIAGFRTEAGRYVNHSGNPNCEYVKLPNGDIYLMSLRDIHGCRGGDKGEELTVDYRKAVVVAGEGDEQCQA